MNNTTKPIDSILTIASALADECSFSMTKILTNQGTDFDYFLNKRVNVFYLEKGKLSLKLKSNKKILEVIEAPALLGLESLFKDDELHYLSSDSSCSLMAFSKEAVLGVISKKNMWVDVSMILCYLINLHYSREHLLYQSNVYGVVKSHLEIMYALPEEERLNVSIFDFILNRASISRSSLNKIVKELEFGNYIETKRGILINLKSLPNDF